MEKREFGLDLVRVAAVCLLFWLHFLLRNGFYEMPVDSVAMTGAVAGRIVFMCCIPLFLMLTGYLKCNKSWNISYYRSLIPILLSWLIISLIHWGYKVLFVKEEMSLYEYVVALFDFKLANYSWYIEMYIGLFLVSPFLNLAWASMRTKKQHLAMVASFMLLTFVPSTLDGICLDGEHMLNPFPNYWTGLYFFTYYLIGCYIRTYKPKVKACVAFSGAVLIALFFALLNRYSGGAEENFYAGYTISYNHLGTAAISLLLFLGIYQVQCLNSAVCACMKVISSVTLEMYLISYVFDSNLYVWQKGTYGGEEFWWRGLLLCGLVFVLSFVSGWMIHQVTALLSGIVWRGKSCHNKDSHIF